MKSLAATLVIVLLLTTTLFGNQSQQDSTLTDTGVALYLQGDLAGALKALRDAVKKDKSDAKAWHYLGLTLMTQGERNKAVEPFKKAEDLRAKAYAREFAADEGLISDIQLLQLTSMLRDLIEVRAKLLEVDDSQASSDVARMDLENARATAACIQEKTTLVNGHTQVNKSDLEIKRPRAIKHVEPTFPPNEHKPGVNAFVALRAIVGPDGLVSSTAVRQSSGEAFSDEARRAALKSKFSPASICGRTVSSVIQLEYSFYSSR
ncbi:MAG TPA: energy transducer TonB [Pyrinomonadaceae bacterium]|nr:energy transducer TonB [Pyrinomonadaceae bacterium]